MGGNILLSFVIPSYNAAKTIKRCLKSICAIKNDWIEIIVVDDGSYDNTENIVKEFSDNRIRYIKQSNGGVSAARNNGLENALGEYVTFVDADDYIEPLEYEDIIKQIEPDVEIILFTYNVISEENKTRIPLYFDAGKYGEEKAEYLVDRMTDCNISRKVRNNIGGKVYQYIFKKDFLNKFKIRFNERLVFGEDLVFCIQALDKCQSIKAIDTDAYNYVVYASSVSHRYRENIWNEFYNTALAVCNIINDEGRKYHVIYYYGKAAMGHYGHNCNIVKASKKIKTILNDGQFRNSLSVVNDKDFFWYERILNCLYKLNLSFFVALYYEISKFIKK